MIPFASSNNLRLVLLNLREAGKSTPFTDEELIPLSGGDKGARVGFMKQRVLELAAFFSWYIEKEQIPPLQELDGQKTGGFSLITWSAGNAYGVSFLGFAEIIPSQQRQLIERYMRSYVLYGMPSCLESHLQYLTRLWIDPVHSTLGVPPRPIHELYNILNDPAASQEQKAAAWMPRLVGNHSRSGPYVVQSLSVATLAGLPPVLDFLKQLQTSPDPIAWDLKTLDPVLDPGMTRRVFIPMIANNLDVLAECTAKALTKGYTEDSTDKHFPNIKMECVGCAESLPDCVYGVYWLKRTVLEHQAMGSGLREINFRIVNGASHAVSCKTMQGVRNFH